MSDTSISVTRTINAPVGEVFDYLTLPANHVELDGSGFVRSVSHGDRIQEVGQVFTMNMEGDHMGGEYQTDNHVVAYARNAVVGWATAPAGTEPPGWTWVWELTSDGTDQTDVTVTYDWSKVTDKELLQKVKFPLVEKSALEDSLAKLAEGVA
ncbi:MAG TPA: hypothetical protein K8V15_07970 [Tessaracoccus flavescens]|uniref:Polyketide cyclase n=1 Tax=Tessaracoccus flavescens TaxID=399497 RepID=A0A921ENR8_9ACTN|nr:hypothetical protein [Tessaracoccus flavescens]